MTVNMDLVVHCLGTPNTFKCRVMMERGRMMSKAAKALAHMEMSEPGACAGRSLLEMMWEELDAIVARLMSDDGAAEDGRDPGRAEGVAACIAIVQAPYNPSWEVVRDEAMDRYYEANPEDDDE